MTYEIGQKVTTPHGDGVIISMSEIDNEYEVEYPYKELTTSFFGIESLQPYKTARDKLIEMGLSLKITKNWMGGVFSHEWWNDNDDIVLVFFVYEKVITVYEANHDIMRIIPQYLEEMEE